APAGLAPTAASTTPRAPLPGLPLPATPGATVYQQSCASCHGQQGEGTGRGPSLVGVGAASVDFQLSTGRMPPQGNLYQPEHRAPAFSADEIDALVRHVTAFGGGGPPVPHVGAGDAATGRRLYLATCAACHSATGFGAALTNGRIAPPLDRATPTQVAEAIRVGPGLMPAFPDTVLDDQEVAAIAAYVEVLRPGRGGLDRGGLSLARVGPVAEGLVAWIVGLALVVLAVRRLGSRARE
ncbi:c-type cytochrome, partial [Micromonospora sp. NPDC049679]|uniref:cytochrome bc1 complex diheme cytochrome c subunit n=1 Tax=Micromonospora sp. NPDC049679 TaxID=3155920 RepID=UPI0033EA67C2